MTESDPRILIADQLQTLSHRRAAGKTFCPSEVVRALSTELPEHWREYMPLIREIAFDESIRGNMQVTQKGVIIPPSELGKIKGPIRLALTEKGRARNHESSP